MTVEGADMQNSCKTEGINGEQKMIDQAYTNEGKRFDGRFEMQNNQVSNSSQFSKFLQNGPRDVNPKGEIANSIFYTPIRMRQCNNNLLREISTNAIISNINR